MNKIKKILVLCLLLTGVILKEQNVDANGIQPYAAAVVGPVYGRCDSTGRIVIAYMAVVTSNGNGTKFSSITPEASWDSSVPFVVFRYTDNTGATSVPYYHLNYNSNSMYQDVGDFGACPF